MHNTIPGLFNFLDISGKGFVTFKELLKRLYPKLTSKEFKIIFEWIDFYEKIKSREAKVLINLKVSETKTKKLFPHSAFKRLKEIFDLYDINKKGCNNCFIFHY